MENFDCNKTNVSALLSSHSSGENKIVSIVALVFGLLSMLSVIAVLCAICCYYRLYKEFVYRLILYTMILVLLLTINVTVDNILYLVFSDSVALSTVCQIIAFLHMWLVYVILLNVTGLTSYWCCLAYKQTNLNGKAIETLFLLTAIVLPFVFVWLPFSLQCYGYNGQSCWIRPYDQSAFPLVLVLDISMIFFSLVILYNSIITIATILKHGYEVKFITIMDLDELEEKGMMTQAMRVKYKQAFKDISPFILFAVFVSAFPVLTTYSTLLSNRNNHTNMAAKLFSSIFGLVCALMSVCHLCLTRKKRLDRSRRPKSPLQIQQQSYDAVAPTNYSNRMTNRGSSTSCHTTYHYQDLASDGKNSEHHLSVIIEQMD